MINLLSMCIDFGLAPFSKPTILLFFRRIGCAQVGEPVLEVVLEPGDLLYFPR